MSFNQISFGEPKRNESPSVNVRPPTESGNPSSLDPLDWATFGLGNTSNQTTMTYEVKAGNLGLALMHDGTGGPTSTPTGWTQLHQETSSTCGVTFWARILDGSEDGTVTFTYSGQVVIATNTVNVPAGFSDLNDIEFNFSGGTSNPPSVTPTTGDTKYFYLAGCNYMRNFGGPFEPVTFPDNYTRVVEIGNTANDASMWLGQRTVSDDGTEDPTTFAFSHTALAQISYTIAIPAGGADPDLAGFDHTHTENEVTDHTTLTQKVTPVAADKLLLYDSADSHSKKWIQVDDLPTGGSSGGSGSFDEHLADTNRLGTPAFVREFNDAESDDATMVEDTSPTLTKTKVMDRLLLYHPGGDAAAELHGIVWAYAPAGDFYIEGAYSGIFDSGQYYHAGLVCSNGATWGSSSTQVTLQFQYNVNRFQYNRYTSWSARPGSANVGLAPSAQSPTRVMYMRMAFVSSTGGWTFYASHTGRNWIQLGTTTQALTTSHVGFGISSYGNATPADMDCHYIAAYTGTP